MFGFVCRTRMADIVQRKKTKCTVKGGLNEKSPGQFVVKYGNFGLLLNLIRMVSPPHLKHPLGSHFSVNYT